jgi:NAD(P)H-nitrite reductase large subunit
VVNISYEGKTVELKDGKKVPVDILVMATGTKALVPDLPGIVRPGIFTLKTLEDAIKIKTYLREKKCRWFYLYGDE